MPSLQLALHHARRTTRLSQVNLAVSVPCDLSTVEAQGDPDDEPINPTRKGKRKLGVISDSDAEDGVDDSA
jgi:hypothetical protein